MVCHQVGRVESAGEVFVSRRRASGALTVRLSLTLSKRPRVECGASAVLDYGRKILGLKRIVGITTPDNHGSIRVLEKLGLKFEKMVKLFEDDIELKLFAYY